MVRVACQICGAEILPATADRNGGLCGRCAKGHRPCIYCGQHVSESLKHGTYAHVGCSIRHSQLQESFNWKRVEDIDWEVVRQMLRAAATQLFQRVTRVRQDSASVTVTFCVCIQDFIDIMVYEVEPDGSSKGRLTDSEWIKDLSPLDSSFSLMYETLSEPEAFDAADRVGRALADILSEIGNELAKHNFYFPNHVQVSWNTKNA